MDDVTNAFAKLAGTLKGVQAVLAKESDNRGARHGRLFEPSDVGHYFKAAARDIQVLKKSLPKLFDDFHEIGVDPTAKMVEGHDPPYTYSRDQVEALARMIDEAFELRANSELERPVADDFDRVFISHGRANYWPVVQSYIEKDLKIPTIELAQQPNEGRTVLQKLDEESDKCSFAVIVMSGDDTDSDGIPRARENVIHEIGYFQGKYGLNAVALLHEEGTNIPSNIHGVVYIPFAKDNIQATLGALTRELFSFFKR
jgi:hypothetical protein